MKRLVMAAAVAGALAACGGGGGDSGGAGTPATPALAFNADAALTTALTKGVSISGLSGRDPSLGILFTASIAFAPAADALFDGVLHKRSTQTSSVSATGIPAQTAITQIFYATAPARFIGSTSNAGFVVFTSRGALPTAGAIGQSGAFADGVIFTSSAKSTRTGTVAVTWSIEADTATTAFACLTSVTSGSTPATEKDCFKIDSAGTILGGKIALTASGVNLTLQ